MRTVSDRSKYIHNHSITKRFMETEKENGRYYIGRYYFKKCDHRQRIDLEMSIAVSPEMFFDLDFISLKHYLYTYGVGNIPSIEILQMQIEERPILDCPWTGTYKIYNVIRKTHWLKIVQRKWRAVMKARAEQQKLWNTPRYQRHRDTYAHGLSLRGMLFDLPRAIPISEEAPNIPGEA